MKKPKEKVAISLRPDVLRRARAAVARGDARSVSAYIEHAVPGPLAAETAFDAMIEETLAASGGPPSAAERRAARRLLSGSAA